MKNIFTATRCLYFFIIILSIALDSSLCAELFYKDDPNVVEIFKVADLKKILAQWDQTETAIGVLYYSRHCPHCKVIAPIYSSVASYVKCNSRLKLYAFECSESEDADDRSDGKHTPLQMCVKEDVDRLATLMVYYTKPIKIGDCDYAENCTILTKDKTQISPINIQNILSWFSEHLPSKVTQCFLHHANPATLENALNSTETTSDFLELIKLYVPYQKIPNWESARMNEAKLYEHDAIRFLQIFLRTWVPVSLTKSQMSTLSLVVYMSRALFRFKDNVDDFKKLYKYMKKVQEHEIPWNYRVYQSILDELRINNQWTPPRGSKFKFMKAKQISSALWTYMHVMSISLLNGHNEYLLLQRCGKSVQHYCRYAHHLEKTIPYLQLVDSDNIQKKLTPKLVATIFKRIVEDFFECQECRDHFLFAYNHCGAHRCIYLDDDAYSKGVITDLNDSYEGLVIWLWRFHSMVSFRTNIEQTANSIIQSFMSVKSDPSETQPIIYIYDDMMNNFPTKTLCAKCYRSDSNGLEREKISFNALKRSVIMQITSINVTKTEEQRQNLQDLEIYDQVGHMSQNDVLRFLKEFYTVYAADQS